MKKIILSALGGVILCLLLASCGPVYRTNYTYIPPKAWRGRQCVNKCLKERTYCNIECRKTYQSCIYGAQEASKPAYRAYVKQRTAAGKEIWANPNDFADTYNCNKNCNCEPQYRQCYTNCGGQVVGTTVCVADCSQKKT